MPPSNKKAQHCKKIAQEREEQKISPRLNERVLIDPPTKANVDMMVLSGIMEGNSYASQKRQVNRLNMIAPAKSTYYRHQSAISKSIVNAAKETIFDAASNIKNNPSLATDGQWNHKRHGSAANITTIDTEQNKVVAWSHISKSKGSFIGNYTGSSNNMESAGVENNIKQLAPFIADKSPTIIHDHDNKTSKLLKNAGFNIQESLDPGHAKQELQRNANSHFERCAQDLFYRKNPDLKDVPVGKTTKKGRKKKESYFTITDCRKAFAGLIAHLIQFFTYLVHNIFDKNEREKQWKNSKNHYLGDHSNCVHPADMDYQKRGRPKKKGDKEKTYWEWNEGKNDEILQKNLSDFLDITTPLVRNTGPKRTQQCESVNAKIANYAPKNRVFSQSNEARAAAAIGKKNDPHFETSFIQNNFPDAISTSILSEMRRQEEEDYINSIKRNTNPERIKKNITRQKERSKNKSNSGDYNIKPPKSPFIH